VYIAKGKTGGQQEDPLEMLIFNLTVHHIWGRVLATFQGVRVVAYADNGYIKGNLSEALQVLAERKRTQRRYATPQLTQLSDEVSLDSFLPDGFVGIGVPIGTDTFVRQFVAKTWGTSLRT
jgi:hypothetical protein